MVVNEYIDGLIADFLADKISQEDHALLKKWIESSPENKRYFEIIQDAWIASGKNSLRYNSYAAFAKFTERQAKSRNRKLNFFWAAAAVSAIIISSFLGFHSGKKSTVESLADIIIETPSGTRTKIWLPDSTSIWLNSSSKIVYPQSYGLKERKVTLRGEGLFEVRHCPDKPFTVISDGISVTDMGTRFDFKNYESDKESIISVLEGSISLTGGLASQVVMKANEMAVINKLSGSYKIYDTEDSKSVDWIAGMLTFYDDLMSDIASVLERAYDVKFIFVDPEVADIRFYGSFTFSGESLNSVLNDLASTGNLSYSISRDTVKIFRKNY